MVLQYFIMVICACSEDYHSRHITEIEWIPGLMHILTSLGQLEGKINVTFLH